MKSKDKKAGYTIAQNVMYILKTSIRYSKVLLPILLIYTLCGVLVPFFGIYLPKIAVDELLNGQNIMHIMLTIGSYTLMFAIIKFIHTYTYNRRYWITNNMRMYLMYELFKKTLYCDYNIIESVEGRNSHQKSIDSLDGGDWSGVSRILPAISGLITGILGFFLYSSLLSRLNIIIVGLLILSAAINYLVLRSVRNYEQKIVSDDIPPVNRKLIYLENVTYNQTGGKDIRIYRMQKWLMDIKDRLLKEYMGFIAKIQNKKLLSAFTNVVTILLRDGFAYVYLIIMTLRGRIVISDFVLYFGAIVGFSSWITQLVNQSHEISSSSLQINNMREFFDIDDAPELKKYQELPKDEQIEIVFRDVCFAYSDGVNVIDHLNLTINKGEKIALVGLNGAGKTTLIKLLCGFYKAQSGEILLNGININEFRRGDLFDLFSAVFQDVMILPFTVAENVALCSGCDLDRDKVTECLEKAGILSYFKGFGNNIDEYMEKVVSDKGIVLSGGQKQKLLIARALYKDAPVLILDEPSAALDPIAESELYNEYNRLSSDKTSIFISHRLASARFCDKIALLSNGYIKECGTHEHLLEMGGEYADLFKVQSHYYQKNIEDIEVAS